MVTWTVIWDLWLLSWLWTLELWDPLLLLASPFLLILGGMCGTFWQVQLSLRLPLCAWAPSAGPPNPVLTLPAWRLASGRALDLPTSDPSLFYQEGDSS